MAQSRWRVVCHYCGEGRKTAYWADAARTRVLARCIACGANFHGPGVWLPVEGASRTGRGLEMEVDPHAEHRHGHGRHIDGRQGELKL